MNIKSDSSDNDEKTDPLEYYKKKFSKMKYIKSFMPGEAFGEIALLSNAPR